MVIVVFATRSYARKHGLLLSKYMRKVAWRLMIKMMLQEVVRFIQSRLGELKISEARCEDLLAKQTTTTPQNT